MNSNSSSPTQPFSIVSLRALSVLGLLFLLISPLRATTLLCPIPESSTTLFGAAIAAVGDVNGDGIADLAVGEPFADGEFNGEKGFGPPQNVGRVFLISGKDLTVIRKLNDPDYQMVTTAKFSGQLGASVAAAGDLNSDGVPDIIAGVPHYKIEDGKTEVISTGKAYVFSGKDGSVLLTLSLPSPEENARAGFSVAGLGDIDSDRKPDYMIGAPGKNIGVGEGGKTDVGVVYMFSGATGSLIRAVSDPDSTVGAGFGAAMANAGDVDGDGVSDALIGAPGKGQCFVFSGKSGLLLFTLKSPVREKRPSFGFAVAGGKDFDGDGKPDFVVGSPLLQNSRGAVSVFKGDNGKLLRTLSIPSPQNFARAGASVAAIDDVTGDGRPDIMVGVPQQNVNGVTHAGEALIFDGATGVVSQVLTSSQPQAAAGFGSAVIAVDFAGGGTVTPVIGVPYQNADVIDPIDGDLETHIQIGQIEIQ